MSVETPKMQIVGIEKTRGLKRGHLLKWLKVLNYHVPGANLEVSSWAITGVA